MESSISAPNVSATLIGRMDGSQSSGQRLSQEPFTRSFEQIGSLSPT